ncbi:MAG TPA: ATP-dependent DNA ligase [Syntrophomonadaceae bacterium]|nr:ATP-dependent DNA ligase [Syntrophomonadaceae bacterium]
MPAKTTVNIGGVEVRLSNLDKVLYPATGFTKARVLDYYVRIAPALIPHLADRPVTFKRYPDGVEGKFFYQKECPEYRPEWVLTAPVWSESNDRNINFCLLNDLPSLVWAVNLAAIELHTSLSLARDPLTPTMLIFDLDPGPPAGIIECSEVALLLRRLLEHADLKCFPKTSGSKGLQIYVPLNLPTSYEETKSFAKACAEMLESRRPDLVVSRMTKSLRTGKVFIDWSQNDDHKTTVCVYSLRAKERPTVSTPVTWREVESAFSKGEPDLLTFEAEEIVRRFEEFGDLFAPVLTLKQELYR